MSKVTKMRQYENPETLKADLWKAFRVVHPQIMGIIDKINASDLDEKDKKLFVNQLVELAGYLKQEKPERYTICVHEGFNIENYGFTSIERKAIATGATLINECVYTLVREKGSARNLIVYLDLPAGINVPSKMTVRM